MEISYFSTEYACWAPYAIHITKNTTKGAEADIINGLTINIKNPPLVAWPSIQGFILYPAQCWVIKCDDVSYSNVTSEKKHSKLFR